MSLRGDRLRTAREARGYTPATLGKIVGLEAQQIARWEDSPSNPAAAFIVALADALDVSTDYLLGRSDQFQVIREIDLTPIEKKLVQAHRAGKLIDMLKRYLDKEQPAKSVPLPAVSDPLIKRQNEHRRKQIKRLMKTGDDEEK